MTSLLQIIISIVVGAVIGYITNYFAIKMLFKPHKKYYLFNKIPVPFTPGIIPKKRSGIARNIGKVVGNMLLNQNTIQSKIKEESTYKVINTSINSNIRKLRRYNINTIESVVPIEHKDKLDKFIDSFKNIISEQINNYLQSKYYENTVREVVDREYEIIINTKIEKLIVHDKLKTGIKESLTEIISNDVFIDNILNSLENYIDNLFYKEETLEEFLPEGTIDLIQINIKRTIPILLPKLGDIFENKEIKELFSINIKKILVKLIAELNWIQKMFLDIIQAKAIIERETPSIVENFISELQNSLRSKETKNKVIKIAENYIEEKRSEKLKILLKNINKDKYLEIKVNSKKAIKDVLRNKEDITNSITDTIMRLLDNISDKTLKDILQAYSKNLEHNIKEYIVIKLLEISRSEKSQITVSNFINKNIDYAIYELKIGRIDNYIKLDNNKQKEIVTFLTDTILNTLHEQTPSILNTLNITTMVQDKIDEFPVYKVEEIIMAVIKNELKYINIFGAILGGMIGTINYFMNILMDKLFQ
ncbi:MAG: DUF445 family protein [bacterium]